MALTLKVKDWPDGTVSATYTLPAEEIRLLEAEILQKVKDKYPDALLMRAEVGVEFSIAVRPEDVGKSKWVTAHTYHMTVPVEIKKEGK